MRDKQKSQYQCMNCGTLHWMEDPPDIDEDELGDVTDYDYYEQEAQKELMNTQFENIDNCYCVWKIKPIDKELIDTLKKQTT